MWNLEQSPELAESDKRRAEIMRKSLLPRFQLSQDELTLARGVQKEKALTETLKLLRKPYGEDQREYDAEAKEQTKIDLAEALAEQGKFKEAANRAPQKLKTYYRNIHKAVWRDDSEMCDCPQDVSGTLIIPKFRIVKRIFSEKHAKFMNLLECTKCGFLNVRELTADLSKLKAAQSNAEIIIRQGENVQETLAKNNLSDSDILR